MPLRTKKLPSFPIALALAAVLLASVVVVVIRSGDDSPAAGSGTPTTTGSGITRTPFGQATPANAPGQELYLQEVTIAPHVKLPEHFHEGTQVAYVTAGVLTYSIISGTASITYAGGRTEDVTGPKEVKLNSGDSIVETRGLVHFGANDTDRPVVLQLAALLERAAPLATSVGTGTAGAPIHLTANLDSQARTLFTAGANGSVVYGWNRLVGVAMLDGQSVGVDLLSSVDHVSGSGPISGFITFSFADRSTLGMTMQGAVQASPDTGNAAFAATLGVVGGTGRFEAAKGAGTFVGSRTAALGATVVSTIDLKLEGVK